MIIIRENGDNYVTRMVYEYQSFAWTTSGVSEIHSRYHNDITPKAPRWVGNPVLQRSSNMHVLPRPQLDKVQIEAIELVFGEDNALDEATPDSRDKVFATTMVQQFEKTFPELLTAAGTEVQIIETDGF